MPIRRAVAALILAAVLGSTSLAGAAEPFEIPVVLPLTGPVAQLGSAAAQSLTLLEANVNKSGGINGRPVKFVVSDDQSNPAVTVQLVSRIVASKAPVMIGPSLSASCGAAAPLLRDGPVGLCLSPGIHPEPGSFVFSAAPSTLDLAIVTARYAKRRGWKKIAFICSTDASGVDGEKVLNQAFSSPEFKDIAVVDVEHFGVADLTVAAQMARIKASGAEAIDVWASGTPSTTVMHGIAEAGLDVPVITSYSNASREQLNAYKGYMPKELLMAALPTIVTPDQLPRGRLRGANDAYWQAFAGIGVRPNVLNGSAWDAGQLIVNVLRRLGPNATAAQVRDTIDSLHDVTGVVGTYDFRSIPQRGVDWKSSVLMVRYDASKDAFVSVGPIGG